VDSTESRLIYLKSSIGEVHDDSPGGPEPSLERRNPGKFVSLFDLDVCAGLEEMLLHVVHEVVQQLHLLLKVARVGGQVEVVLASLVVNVVDVAEKKQQKIILTLLRKLFMISKYCTFVFPEVVSRTNKYKLFFSTSFNF
jgi:hypothetical protein